MPSTNPKLSFRNIRRLMKIVNFFRDHDEFTRLEFQTAAELGTSSAITILNRMWREGPDKCIRVCAWRDDRMGRPTIRVYEFGTGPDAPKRPPMTRKEISIRYLINRERKAQLLAQRAIHAMSSTPRTTEVS